jgi:hypothetical protein
MPTAHPSRNTHQGIPIKEYPSRNTHQGIHIKEYPSRNTHQGIPIKEYVCTTRYYHPLAKGVV